jgi:FAD/FMN-containing dehydrogenase
MGTLAVLTEVALRLVPRLPARVAALVALPDADAAVALLAVLRAAGRLARSGRFLPRRRAAARPGPPRGRPRPVPRAPVHVLVQVAARTDPTQELAAALASAGVDDRTVLADDGAGRERLWRLREGHTEAINAAGIPHKLDVGVPVAELPRFLAQVPRVVARAAPGARTILFGHLGDGNVHVNVLGAAPDDPAVDDAVLALAAACGGTISAEHGVGVAKARHLGLVRGSVDLAAMRRVKAALDPAGILNPGAVL